MALTPQAIGKSGIGLGAALRGGTAIMWNRCGATALKVGNCVMVDVTASDGDSSKTQTNTGADNFPANNVILPTTAGAGVLSGTGPETGQPMGIVVDLLTGAGADNTQVLVQFQGWCFATMDDTVASGLYGVLLMPKNGDPDLDVKTGAGPRAIGRLFTDATTAGATALILLDGLNGMGSSAAS